MSSIVQVKNLIKKYGDFCAIDNLSLDVKQGEIFGLLGPNGAGKSTTLSVITTLSGFEKGSVTVDGLDVVKNSMEIKKLIGLVPQDIAVYDHLTAIENVRFFASLYGFKGNRLQASAVEALEFVGLSDKHKLKPKAMSGGMKRRLNIACGIAHSPKLIVMDEPTVGVDAQSREHILSSIRILKERGSTVIYTSHYMNEVEEICDRIAIIDKGKLIACGTKNELVSLVTDIKTFLIETKIPVNFNTEDLKKQLAFIPGVKSIVIENDLIRADASIEHDNFAMIVTKLTDLKLPIKGVSSQVPNLDTTFLTLTGHELR